MAENSNKVWADWAWRIFTILVGLVVGPLAAWVWTMNVRVVELENEHEYMEREIVALQEKAAKAEARGEDVIGMKKDIEYMKASLVRIEQAVAQ
jgi:hypothetical protein